MLNRILKLLKKESILIVILLFASFLRLYNLNQLPSGFETDEADYLVNTISIMQTGHDEDRKIFPIYFTSIIDPNPSLYSYLQIPFVKIIGPTHTAARLPSVLFGIISIFLIFILFRKFTTKRIALLSTFLISISPWHIMLSRASDQVIVAFAFMLGAILSLLPLLIRNKFQILSFAVFAICFVLALYLYPAQKVFLPLFIILLLCERLIRKKLSFIRVTLIAIIVFLLTLILTVYGGFTRFNAVSVFTNQQTQLVLNEKIGASTLADVPHLLIRIVNNKIVDYTLQIVNNYFQYFTANYLFLSGGQPPRYAIPFQGLFFLVDIVFFAVGLGYSLINNRFKKATYFFLLWLVIAPIPAALTIIETPSTIRSFQMIIPVIYFISVGIYSVPKLIISKKMRKVVLLLTATSYIACFGYFVYNFMVLQPFYQPVYRNYADEILPKVLQSTSVKYVRIFVANDPYLYFTLDHVISIKDIQNAFPNRRKPFASFDKYVFTGVDCFIEPKPNMLYVIRSTCNNSLLITTFGYYHQIGSVNLKNGLEAYKLITFISKK